MKTLSFFAENKELYESLYSVALGAPIKGNTDILNCFEVQKAFRRVGILDPNDTKDKIFYTITEDCVVELEDSYFNWLKSKFEEAQFSNSIKVDMLVQIIELLKNPK